MRKLTSRRPQAVLLVTLFMFGVLLACNLPFTFQKEKNFSQEDALQLVLDEVVQPDQLGEDPLVIFAWPEVLVPGDVLQPYNIFGEDPVPGLVTIKAESWFFWIEDEPYGQFSHQSRFVLVDINSGKISSSDEEWWPVLNGQSLWADTEEYKNEENWAWSNVSFMNPEDNSRKGSSSIMAAMLPPLNRSSQTEGGTRKALVINTVTEDQRGEEDGVEDAGNMLGILARTDFETTYLGTEYDDNPKRLEAPFTPGRAAGVDPWQKWLQSQAGEMESGDTLVVYINGHGNVNDLSGEGWIANENGEIFAHTLKNELGKFNPGVDIIVIIQSCNSGAFTKYLEDVADLTMTATDATGTSYGDMDYLFSWISLLAGTDLNPNDEGSEYTSSLVAGWEEILDDPDAIEEVKQRAKDEGITFMQALIIEAYEEGRIYDMAVRMLMSFPQVSFGSAATKPTASATPTSTPTPEPSPTSSFGYSLGDYRVSMAVKKDKGGHKGFIGMPGTITLTLKEGSIQIQGPHPWVSVSGEINEDGIISASGRGTVAGYQNIKVNFLGSAVNGRLEGDYTMGANGGLPGGQAIVYSVSGEKLQPTATPTPDPRLGELQEFFATYNGLFQSADVAGLLALLHPGVLDLYGQSACQDYLSSIIDKPIHVEVLQLQSFEPWTWEIDGRSTDIEDAYSILAEVSAAGQTIQQSMHLGLAGDGSISWFTDCGEPLP